ncbi:MAG: D-alanine--D-alanine ligase [Patescibacteria group bacterium]
MPIGNTNAKKDVIRVAVLMGGPSAEHEVSLKSGKMVLQYLNPQKYDAHPVIIDKKGKWPMSKSDFKKRFDVAFIAMHGEYGEDGGVQKVLEKMGVKYTGSDAKASKLGMDKEKSYKIFIKKGLKVAKFVTNLKKINQIGLPLVIKPVDRGSSIGVSLVNDYQDVTPAIKNALKYSAKIMAQEYIKGREMTCGVIEYGKNTIALLPTEIIPKTSNFFDYNAKYKTGASKEITPPRLSHKQIVNIQKTAIKAHKAIGAKSLSRADFILGKDPASRRASKALYILEVNTLPGMTETSLLPQAAKAVGISFKELLEIIIANALEVKSIRN